MGILEVLTIIFVACKLLNIGICAHWSWFQCLLPEIVAVFGYLIIIAVMAYVAFSKPQKRS